MTLEILSLCVSALAFLFAFAHYRMRREIERSRSEAAAIRKRLDRAEENAGLQSARLLFLAQSMGDRKNE